MRSNHKHCDREGCGELANCTVEEYERKYAYCLKHGLECVDEWLNAKGEKGKLTVDRYSGND